MIFSQHFSFFEIFRFSGSCGARVFATLQIFTPEWFLMAQLVDWGSLEMCVLYWVFSELLMLCRLCCAFLWSGRKSECGRWNARGERQVRQQPWMRHDAHQMTWFFSGAILELGRPWAKRVMCVPRLWSNCTAQMCNVSGCPAPPVDFLDFLPGNRNHHHFSDDVGCHELQLVCHCEVCHCEVEDETLPAGFTVALCSTAIQFSDRHSNRSFLLMADFVVDAADVLDVSVSEIAAFPPSEHLAFWGIKYSPHGMSISFGPSSVSNVPELSEASYESSLHRSAAAP